MLWIIFIKKNKEYTLNKKREILITLNDMIDDMLSNEKLNLIVTELFIKSRKLKIYFINLLHNLILLFQKILDQILRAILLWKFQTNKNFNMLHLIIHQIWALKALWIFTKKCCKTIFFLVIDATLASDNPLRYRKNFLEKI